jgi:hypothetical protein
MDELPNVFPLLRHSVIKKKATEYIFRVRLVIGLLMLR